MALAEAADIRPPGPVSRPRELQDPLNFYCYHPLARRLALLLRPTGISPNLVSVMSALCLCAAAPTDGSNRNSADPAARAGG